MNAFCTLLIPARRNSKRVPGKNVSLFAGKPLIQWSLDLWSQFADEIDIIVSTDDPRVMELATTYPHIAFRERVENLADDVSTLDEVARFVASTEKIATEFFAIAQCTCPLLSATTARELLSAVRSSGRTSIVAATKEHGFFWKLSSGEPKPSPLFEERVNTQYAKSTFVRESGVFTATRLSHLLDKGTRFDDDPLLITVPKAESLDIDDRVDWRIGQSIASRYPITFVAICNTKVGTGHVHRCLEVSSWFSDLEQSFVVLQGDGIEAPIFREHNHAHRNIETLDELQVSNSIVVLDVLDVDAATVASLKANGNWVFIFESRLLAPAHFTFNSLYRPDPNEPEGQLIAHGPKCSVTNKFLLLRENRFAFRDDVENVVVFFGGTDPSNLRKRIMPLVDASFSGVSVHVYASAIAEKRETKSGAGNRILEKPLGAEFFATVEAADLFIGSAGQTMMQVAHIGVPSVIVSHSLREEQHIFGDVVSCITYAGCASNLDDADILRTIQYASSRYRRKLVSDYCRLFSLAGGNEFVHRKMRATVEGWTGAASSALLQR
jgi:CMP-N-acetylneuraminic acid synthetase